MRAEHRVARLEKKSVGDAAYVGRLGAFAASRRALSFAWAEQQCPIAQWNWSLHSCEQ
ncbi:hypothetical protein X011_00415 [Mycobacterium tuberculosis variant microti OV254]|nr:hypothetical protein X011_00415 [Mycobacterium tuberculosis variant microti OV254]